MDEKIQQSMDEELSTWFSTYGLITVERILSQLGFHLKHDELIRVIHDANNIYYAFLQTPFKNILNGIILSQARDYREYAQKLFIDYLVSGAGNIPGPEEAAIQAGSSRDVLEKERQHLIEIGDSFDLEEFEHNKLIAESQRVLISLAKEMNNQSLSNEDCAKVQEQMQVYDERAKLLTNNLRQYRTRFYEIILQARDLLETLPEYRPDEVKIRENRSMLNFDSHIGEQK